jgi:hypothetical protein
MDRNITSFHLGTYVQAISRPHGINQLFLVSKLSLNLLSPAANKLTLGAARDGLTGAVTGLTNSQGEILKIVEGPAQAAAEAEAQAKAEAEAKAQAELNEKAAGLLAKAIEGTELEGIQYAGIVSHDGNTYVVLATTAEGESVNVTIVVEEQVQVVSVEAATDEDEAAAAENEGVGQDEVENTNVISD